MVKAPTTASFSLPLGPDSRWALFIDLDGTLLDLCANPQRVIATYDIITLLPALQRTFNGAVALLSGRPIREIDRILFPLQLPCAGLHGAERRTSSGNITRLSVDNASLDTARVAVGHLVRRPGVDVEVKPLCLAIHTRVRSAYEEAERSVEAIAAGSGGLFRMQRGRHVVELVPRAANTGRALLAFLDEPVFASRRPLVFGDDATDADAFKAAAERNGVAVGVGDHAPPAERKVASARECRRLLSELVNLGDLGLVG